MRLGPLRVLVLLLALAACDDDSVDMGPRNHAPSVTAPDSLDATVGQPVEFSVVYSDPDGNLDTITVAPLLSLSEWQSGIRGGEVSADWDTGEIMYTPAATDTPRRSLRIRATDTEGAETVVDVMLRVAPASTR